MGHKLTKLYTLDRALYHVYIHVYTLCEHAVFPCCVVAISCSLLALQCASLHGATEPGGAVSQYLCAAPPRTSRYRGRQHVVQTLAVFQTGYRSSFHTAGTWNAAQETA